MEIKIKKRLTIVPLGDVHFRAPMHADSHFKDWCRKYRARVNAGEDIWFIGLGDYLETLSGSERKKCLPGMHESTREWLDEKIMNDIDALCERLDFTRGRWLGMLSGNHNYINGDGATITQMVAQRLDAKALGICAAIRIGVVLPGKKPRNYDIWAHHGRGGGRLAGSTLNSLEAWANGLLADLVLMGHDHKRAATAITRLEITGVSHNNASVTDRETWLCRTGSFLKGYEDGKVSYAVGAAMRPITIGSIEINVRRCNTVNKFDHEKYDRLVTEVTL